MQKLLKTFSFRMAIGRDLLTLYISLFLVSKRIRKMHAPTYKESNEFLTIIASSDQPYPQEKLSKLIVDKIAKREIFYGIEISSQAKSKLVIDYNEFKVKPLFTSVVWVGEVYSDIEPIIEASAVKAWKLLRKSSIVLPHLTCYRMNSDKLNQLLLPEFKNVLLLRGDSVDQSQEYKVAADLVKAVRSLRNKDDLSIAVGGYPEVHPAASSTEKDLDFLKQKIDAGADIIITQVCFSSATILKFIKNCRSAGINVPIIPGIFIPHNYRILSVMCKITEVSPSDDEMLEYTKRKDDEQAFIEYANEMGTKLVKELIAGGVPGVQFFTINYFENVKSIVDQLF